MQIVVEIDETRIGVLERIRENAGLHSYRDVFNNSLTLLDWAIRQRAAGRIVATLDETNHSYKELAMGALKHVRRSHHKTKQSSR